MAVIEHHTWAGDLQRETAARREQTTQLVIVSVLLVLVAAVTAVIGALGVIGTAAAVAGSWVFRLRAERRRDPD
jgi:Flp pilus assembly protein TadB